MAVKISSFHENNQIFDTAVVIRVPAMFIKNEFVVERNTIFRIHITLKVHYSDNAKTQSSSVVGCLVWKIRADNFFFAKPLPTHALRVLQATVAESWKS